MPRVGEKEFLRAYRGWVFACVNAIAQRISEIEVNLEKKNMDSWKAVESHPALDILHNVNDFMSYSDLMFGTQAFQELTGNHFWYLMKNKGGTISEIWPLNPTRTLVVKSPEAFIPGYVFTNETGEKEMGSHGCSCLLSPCLVSPTPSSCNQTSSSCVSHDGIYLKTLRPTYARRNHVSEAVQ